jgi:outer membrane protein assembly factor BamD
LINVRFLLIILATLILVGCGGTKKDLYKGMDAAQIYAQGQRSVAKSNYAQAIKDFEALEARYPYGEYSHQAQLALIDAYYKKNETALAISAADRFIRMNPRHSQVDYAYYLKGLVHYDQNTTFSYKHLPLDRSARDTSCARESFESIKELVEIFPNSQYAPEARQRMAFLRNQLASHELQVVAYYMKRGAYLAAANRANYIVKNFDRTPVVAEALSEMAVAYQKLGMTQLSNDAIATLKNNFPHHPVPNGLPR